jgi:hypothetical protein
MVCKIKRVCISCSVFNFYHVTYRDIFLHEFYVVFLKVRILFKLLSINFKRDTAVKRVSDQNCFSQTNCIATINLPVVSRAVVSINLSSAIHASSDSNKVPRTSLPISSTVQNCWTSSSSFFSGSTNNVFTEISAFVHFKVASQIGSWITDPTIEFQP